MRGTGSAVIGRIDRDQDELLERGLRDKDAVERVAVVPAQSTPPAARAPRSPAAVVAPRSASRRPSVVGSVGASSLPIRTFVLISRAEAADTTRVVRAVGELVAHLRGHPVGIAQQPEQDVGVEQVGRAHLTPTRELALRQRLVEVVRDVEVHHAEAARRRPARPAPAVPPGVRLGR